MTGMYGHQCCSSLIRVNDHLNATFQLRQSCFPKELKYAPKFRGISYHGSLGAWRARGWGILIIISHVSYYYDSSIVPYHHYLLFGS